MCFYYVVPGSDLTEVGFAALRCGARRWPGPARRAADGRPYDRNPAVLATTTAEDRITRPKTITRVPRGQPGTRDDE